MRGILKFNLPEESEEFRLAQQGVAMSCAISGFMQALRQKMKHENFTEDGYEVGSAIQKMAFEFLGDHHE